MLFTIISINGNCVTEDQNNKAEQSSGFNEFVGEIKCGIKFGAKKTGDAIRSSYNYVKNKLTPKKDEEKFDVRSAVIDTAPESDVTTVNMTVNDRSLFEAPCQGFLDRNGVCRKSD